jgi:predicted nucleic acid-binding protein
LTVEFVDTNVLVYAYDPTSGDRHTAARVLLERLWQDRTGALSVQVLQEFFVTVTTKVAEPLALDDARHRLRGLARWAVHAPLPMDVIAATEIAETHKLLFWDAMVVRSAGQLGCEVLWTEDLNAGQRIGDVTIRDPFA